MWRRRVLALVKLLAFAAFLAGLALVIQLRKGRGKWQVDPALDRVEGAELLDDSLLPLDPVLELDSDWGSASVRVELEIDVWMSVGVLERKLVLDVGRDGSLRAVLLRGPTDLTVRGIRGALERWGNTVPLLNPVAARLDVRDADWWTKGELCARFALRPDDGSLVIGRFLVRREEPPWAGRWLAREGVGVMGLELRGGRFVFTGDGCFGEWPESRGCPVPDGSSLRFRHSAWVPQLARIYPSELVIVPWGSRTYLVPPERMVAFAVDAREGREPRGRLGPYLLRAGDERLPVTGRPEIPSELAWAWTIPRIAGRITSLRQLAAVPPQAEDAWLVELDAGAQSGFYLGMEVEISEHGVHSMPGWITLVDDDHSTAELRCYSSAGCPTPEPGLEVVRAPDR